MANSLSDFALRKRAMQFVAQLPDNPQEARRIVEHMRRLLDLGDADDSTTERSPDAARIVAIR